MSGRGPSKNIKDRLLFPTPLNTIKNILISNLAGLFFIFFWALAWTTFQGSLANVGQIFNSPRGREASRRDNSARRQYCILILLILVLFPFKQQLIPCVEVLAWTGAERGAVLTRAGQELPWHNVPSPGLVSGAGLGVPAWPHSCYPHPTDKTKELQKSGRPNHTAEAVSLKTRKKNKKCNPHHAGERSHDFAGLTHDSSSPIILPRTLKNEMCS